MLSCFTAASNLDWTVCDLRPSLSLSWDLIFQKSLLYSVKMSSARWVRLIEDLQYAVLAWQDIREYLSVKLVFFNFMNIRVARVSLSIFTLCAFAINIKYYRWSQIWFNAIFITFLMSTEKKYTFPVFNSFCKVGSFKKSACKRIPVFRFYSCSLGYLLAQLVCVCGMLFRKFSDCINDSFQGTLRDTG